MLLKHKKSWEMPQHMATDEALFLSRREWLKAAGLAGIGIAAGTAGLSAMMGRASAAPITGFPATRNDSYVLDRALTAEQEAITYTNFYEFGSSKTIWRKAQKLETDPWMVTIDGMVEEELKIDAAELITKLGSQEERLYRHRCVEAWAMAVPWTGVPFSKLVALARPTSGAKYIRMETFYDPSVAPGQKQSWYPWPYVEGITIEEGMNELALLGTGMYGKGLEKQNGAPLRCVLPWKYGFKGIKSIVKFTFTDQQPVSFWEQLAKNEYGFWANVNPEVAHPRWSQATERMLGSDDRVPTLLYNGYEEQVAGLYAGMGGIGDRLFR
ncbi:MAG: protein-methionine-sulfoxide reductase catalytic subunit MsrP [Alphaproteobacteria bacterium]|jgi:sulfoxide reductase catalytic subunit YedY|nr:protein-methionine-sulfoxide reductase catalytic subunit MsrP [Alphaproteobacteria bacterium]MDG1030882.1 protein-methionine-sulfoxide reductase catalytic subunit MsrP [Alphaproteobacteria bacterium]MDG1413629.1 protein-methionine-sulfoxide reductase catalytic subunit MsrP [Alphaproteobacteria bacterium]HAD72795.1 protein-methionine-sulfoxide reductase catalytic subunit MsrP [Alphaproteobacteria bacterium]|tara:strand:+ start:1479 stop:2456 length:978 start_codon:yes stop_codon:yes gene_type:complete